ncbi:uncharacterized protein LOC129584748 [Paramacrobiotus metropolitanus]|uniref:uncharacterized protein LOC129584748 n=1 Tax=Paramacrobiotus metropolitanus TaxID=2943436 RepID=UPI0024459CA9|nr:uncharacterized protein LOC129584748 [Paramacrobiotus metropolitanus]
MSTVFDCNCLNRLGLECYVCENQEDNYEKCISTVQLCDPEIHDVCSTNVRWGVTFYWMPAGKRIHYLSKACDNMKNCMQRKRALEERCYRDWWADWICEDCCTGDRCNYYVVLSADRTRNNRRMIIATTIVTAVVRQIFSRL